MHSFKGWLAALAGLTLLVGLMAPAPRSEAADHRDSPIITGNPPADIDDVYFFLDPNDNSRAVVAFSLGGPIIPPENVAAGFFPAGANYRLQIENTGDAAADKFIDIQFSKLTAPGQPQLATVTFSAPQTTWRSSPRPFSAPTTPASLAAVAPEPVVTVDEATGIAVFAGPAEDPFFADLPALFRYLESRRSGQPDESQLTTERDSFAGYNVLLVALSIPVSHLRGPAGDVVGLSVYAQARQMTNLTADGEPTSSGPFVTLDRMGLPGVNATFIPYTRKDEYNRATTADDAAGRFAADIAAELKALGTDDVSIDTLLRHAARRGDMLRLNLAIRNAGLGGGTNPEAAYPNGRRPQDDVIDYLITLVNNRVQLGDGVDRNEVAFRGSFPYFASPHQPLPAGSADPTQH